MALELRQQQKQNLSQRMIQSVRILQMTSQELETYVDELALENPTLDVEKTGSESIDAHYQEYFDVEQGHYLAQRHNNDDDYSIKDDWNINTEHPETLKEFLWSQINPKAFSRREIPLLDYILDCLDERGYLAETAAHIADRFKTDEETVEDLIEYLQGLEPAGVCARDLGECLRIQLARKGLLNDDLEALTKQCLELVAKNKTAALVKRLGITPARASGYCALIRTLDPRPGARFYHQEKIQYVVPDVFVTRNGDHFNIGLNGYGEPKITVNAYYRSLGSTTTDKEVKAYLDNKIRQTEWVHQCIEQRHTTMVRVSEEIVRHQQEFFLNGPDHLKPLKMAEIADAIEMHESTVSRAVDHKYLQCSWGLFPMEYFFPKKATSRNSLSAAITDENFISSQVKQALREIIAGENPKKPYSDRALSELLAERGITISRRTVSKYRIEENIPDASGRKHSFSAGTST